VVQQQLYRAAHPLGLCQPDKQITLLVRLQGAQQFVVEPEVEQLVQRVVEVVAQTYLRQEALPHQAMGRSVRTPTPVLAGSESPYQAASSQRPVADAHFPYRYAVYSLATSPENLAKVQLVEVEAGADQTRPLEGVRVGQVVDQNLLEAQQVV